MQHPPFTALDRTPYFEGADGARRSAQCDREYAMTLAPDSAERAEMLRSAEAWEAQQQRADAGPTVEAELRRELGRTRVLIDAHLGVLRVAISAPHPSVANRHVDKLAELVDDWWACAELLDELVAEGAAS